MARGKRKAAQQKEEKEEAILYPQAAVEKVIAASPGLEDDEDPVLEEEALDACVRAFRSLACDGRVPLAKARQLLEATGCAFRDDDQYHRVASQTVAAFRDDDGESLDEDGWLDVARRVFRVGALARRFSLRVFKRIQSSNDARTSRDGRRGAARRYSGRAEILS